LFFFFQIAGTRKAKKKEKRIKTRTELYKKGNEEKLKIKKEGRKEERKRNALFNDVPIPASRIVCGFLVSGLFSN
jgi:hypothetical protein